jgi:drug/metabolite transporter (DMT)-like permease
MRAAEPAPGPRVWTALSAVYILWGSTYLAIRVGVQPRHGAPMPPLLMASTRFTAAGLVLLLVGVCLPTSDGRPDRLGRRQWLAAAIIGISLLLGGNGVVSIAERSVPSGVAALGLATVPMWAAIIDATFGSGNLRRRDLKRVTEPV